MNYNIAINKLQVKYANNPATAECLRDSLNLFTSFSADVLAKLKEKATKPDYQAQLSDLYRTNPNCRAMAEAFKGLTTIEQFDAVAERYGATDYACTEFFLAMLHDTARQLAAQQITAELTPTTP